MNHFIAPPQRITHVSLNLQFWALIFHTINNSDFSEMRITHVAIFPNLESLFDEYRTLTPLSFSSANTAVNSTNFFLLRDESGIINRPWSEITQFLDENNRETKKIRGNGFCFLAAVAKCLLYDHSYVTNVNTIQERVLDHLIMRGDLYNGFHNGTPATLVMQALNFFEDRNFNTRLCDIIVLAVANALNLTIKILRSSPQQQIQVVVISGENSQMEIILKYDTYEDPKNPNYTGANHYDAVIKKNILYRQICDQSPDEQEYNSPNSPEREISDIRPSTATPQSPATEQPQINETSDLRYPDFRDEFDDIPESEESYGIRLQAEEETSVQETSENEGNYDIRCEPSSQGTGADSNPNCSPCAIHQNEGHELKLDPEVEKIMLDMYLRPNTQFPIHLYREGVRPKKVDCLPENIDGLKCYKVKCNGKTLIKNTTDRRWFYMRTTSKAGFRGIRKVGTCQGSWVCVNPECSFLKTEKRQNNSHFELHCGTRVCYSCGKLAGQVACGARKLISYSYGSEYAEVYHFGYHKCQMKHEVTNDRDYTSKWVKKYPGLSFRNLKSTVIQCLLDEGDVAGSKEAAERITYKAYRSCKYYQKGESDTAEVSTQSIEAVVEVKKGSDELDKLYIYEVNNSKMNSLPDFVVKSSSKILEIAVEMDVDGPSNILQDEDSYFDGCHSRCKDFISFGLWVRHPSMRRIIKLAGMETRKEDTEAITIFFSKLNEMLQKVTKRKDYKFNPRHIMMDEAGANFSALKNVFGQEFVDKKCITCQWHFLSNMQEHKHEILENLRDEFLDKAQQLCTRKSVAEFELIFARMREIVSQSPNAGNFLDWHYVRRVRTFPAFREALHAGANAAEIGNAQWKAPYRLSLVSAAKDDINRMLQMETDYEKFTSGEYFLRGQAPNDVQRATAERRFQMEQGRAFADVLRNEAALQMEFTSQRNPPHFRPSHTAKHKPKKKGKGIEGYMEGNRKRQPATLTSLLAQLTKAKGMNTSQNVDTEGDYEDELLGRGPEPRPNRPLPNEKPYVTQSFFKISVCQGCPKEIDSKGMKCPHDLVIRLKAIRPFQDVRTKMWIDRIANIYFHLSIQCLQNFSKKFKLEDLRMTQEMFTQIGEAHLKLLAQKGFLEHIIRNLEAEIQVITNIVSM